jgi:8-oxo-dGTP pyrophosphatase MutT (NUDIX family)
MKIPKTLSTKETVIKDFSILEMNVRFPKGIDKHYVVKFHDGAVAIVVDKKMNVYLAKEWRSGWNQYLIKCPGGAVYGKGEPANIRTVRNELVEELGIHVKKITKLASVPADVRILHYFHIYLAENFKIRKQKLEPFEYIKLIKMPFKKALKTFAVPNSKMTSESVLALLLAKERLKL